MEEFTKRFTLAQQVDNKLRQELKQLISVAMEHQEKLNSTVEQIAKDVVKKGELEMILLQMLRLIVMWKRLSDRS